MNKWGQFKKHRFEKLMMKNVTKRLRLGERLQLLSHLDSVTVTQACRDSTITVNITPALLKPYSA